MATESLRFAILPFLGIAASVLALLVAHVVVLHGARELMYRRRRRLLASYRPVVLAALNDDDPEPSLRALTRVPRRHAPLLATLILEPLRSVKGSVADRALAAARAAGLTDRWHRELAHRRWWRRARAAHALGLVGDVGAVRALVAALEDPSGEVRAAAVEALGLIGDPAAIPELVARLPAHSRYQRVRLVDALQRFGWVGVDALLHHAETHREDRGLIAELLAVVAAPGAVPALLAWSGDPRAEVRASAVRALGAIGVDDRAYYHLLRAIQDDCAEVRAAAAWALGRSGREDAAVYLAPHLQDAWIVAAQTARALRDLGAAGRNALEHAAASADGELARQVLWECGAATPA
jgi:HEAT repeat protein